MQNLLPFAILFPLLIVFALQPILNDAEEARGTVAKIAIERATERAAIEGQFTEEIKNELFEMLERVGYSEEEIELVVTEEQTARGQYVSGTVKVPNKYYFLLFDAMFGQEREEMYHIKSATRMSEYIPDTVS